MSVNRKTLGQYLTPSHISGLLAEQLTRDIRAVVDLAAGDGALLYAVNQMSPEAKLYGVELDPQMLKQSKKRLSPMKMVIGDGLTANIDCFRLPTSKLAVIGNPPYTEIQPSDKLRELLEQGFPGITGKQGLNRSEIYFLARSLSIAKKRKGIVAIVMPIGFGDGDIYRKYREVLMSEYALIKAIELPPNTFSHTEARAILLFIDTDPKAYGADTEIMRYSTGDPEPLKIIFKGKLARGERIDARFHEGKRHIATNTRTLEEMGVTIARGRITRKDAQLKNVDVVHSSDLNQAKNGKLRLSARNKYKRVNTQEIVATVGDILLPRTGSRVNWSPVEIQAGSCAITDHVFRIRAPKQSLHAVIEAFRHPNFPTWLDSITKGVCATVLTKRELLTMPMFSSA